MKLDDKDFASGLGKKRPYISGGDVFATISAAIEAGIVDEKMWPSQLFADFLSFKEFVPVLASYESCYKLIDPWWETLRALVNGAICVEEGFCTAPDLANRFSEALDDLPEQWD